MVTLLFNFNTVMIAILFWLRSYIYLYNNIFWYSVGVTVRYKYVLSLWTIIKYEIELRGVNASSTYTQLLTKSFLHRQVCIWVQSSIYKAYVFR